MCDYIISNKRLHFTSEDISLAVSLFLCSWTCSSSFCVLTVSTVQLQTAQFVQYLYSKCVVLLCSWTSKALCLSVSSNQQPYYIHCVTVWLSSGKKATKMCLLFSLFFRHVTIREFLKTFPWHWLFTIFATIPQTIPNLLQIYQHQQTLTMNSYMHSACLSSITF
jgi:hypothetical protein